MQASTVPTSKEYTREYLKTLKKDEIIAIALQEHSKAKQYAASIRQFMLEKYGPKNERHVSSGQLLFFPDLISGAKSSTNSHSDNTENVPSEATTAKNDDQPKAKKKQPGHNRKPMPEGLPRVTTVAPLPEGTSLPCSCCGNSKVLVRTILQASRYQVIPAYFYIEDLYSAIFGCPICQEKEPVEVIRAKEVGPNSLASPSLLARIAVSRDNDHIPFYRLSQIFNRAGVDLQRSTTSDMFALTVKIVQPVCDYMKTLINQARIISTDDTPVKILDRKIKKNIKTGRFWIYFGSKDQPINILDATASRGRDGPLVQRFQSNVHPLKI
jgi:transposase